MRLLTFAALTCLLLSWLVPLAFNPWVSFHRDGLAFAALAVGLLALASTPAVRPRLPLCVLLLAALAGLPGLQLAAGLLPLAGDTLVYSLFLLALAASVLLGYNAQRLAGNGFINLLAWPMLIGALVSCGLALAQWLGASRGVDLAWVAPLPEGARPFANLSQPNNLATLLGFGVAALIYLFEARLLNRTLALLMALVLLFGLALSQSRTSWLVGPLLVALWAWQRTRQPLRLGNRGMLLGLALFAGLVLLLPVLAEALGLSMQSAAERAQQLHRWAMYRDFVQIILDGPWYGYGWGQVLGAQGIYALNSPAALPATYTHNLLLDVLVWAGPLPGGLILLASAVWLWRLLRGSRSLAACFAWLALIPFILHSQLEFPHAYAFLLLPAGALLGILQAETQPEHGLPLQRTGLLALGLAAVALLAIIWRDYQLVSEDYWQAIRGEQDVFIAEEQQAVSNVWLLTGLRDQVYFIRLPLSAGYNAEQLDFVRNMAASRPRTFELLKAASIMALNRQTDEAEHYLRMLSGLHTTKLLEQAMTMMLEASEEHPEYWLVLQRFGLQPPAETE